MTLILRRLRDLRNDALFVSLLGPLVLVPALAAYYLRLWPTYARFLQTLDHGVAPFEDFQRFYRPMGIAVLATRQPIPGFFYSPTFALALHSGAVLPPELACRLWGTMEVVLTLCLGSLGAALLPSGNAPWWRLAYWLAFLSAFPVLHNFYWGQVSVWMAVTVFGSFWLDRRGQTTLAALCLALGIATKFYAALFLVYFLARRDGRFVGLCLGASLLLLGAVPMLWLGPLGTWRFYAALQLSLAAAQTVMDADSNSQSLGAVAARLFFLCPAPTLGLPAAVLGGLAAAMTFALAVVVCRRRLPWDAEWAMTLLFLATPLFLKPAWPHYFVFLPFCQTFLWQALVASPEAWARKRGHGLLLAASALFSSVFLFSLVGSGQRFSGTGMLFFADVFLLASAWGQLIAQWRRAPERAGPRAGRAPKLSRRRSPTLAGVPRPDHSP